MLVMAASTVFIAATAWAIKEYRYYFFPAHFFVVEPDSFYRGARQTPSMLRRIIEEHHIRAIVNLDDKVLEREDLDRPDADPYEQEKALAKEYGIQYYGFIWEGSGVGPYQEYDEVADILASLANRPVFLHCAAGEKRTNAALAAYWIRHRGYTLEQAVEGLILYGQNPSRRPEFMDHLRGYYEYTKRHPRSGSSVTPKAKRP
jgi:protein tyrosine/serine phosphatase